MTREITHMKAFAAALERMGKDPFTIGQLPPTPRLVDQYFNDSTDQGDASQDFRRPWNQGGAWQYVEAPAFRESLAKTGTRCRSRQ
jgi:Mn-containing catalase